jgi:23S rRNA-/tRNA-specific pseudouridylate synthase
MVPSIRAPWGGGSRRILLLLLVLQLLGLVHSFLIRSSSSSSPPFTSRRHSSPCPRARRPPPCLAVSADEYVLSGPTSDDERVFVLPFSVVAELPLPEAVELFGNFSSPSKARKLIRRGQVWVNGKVCSCQDKAIGGDRVEVRAVEPRVKRKDGKPRGVKKIKVVYEDNDLAVIVKPAGACVRVCVCDHERGGGSIVSSNTASLRTGRRWDSQSLELDPLPTKPTTTPHAGVAVHGTGAYSLVDRYAEFLAPSTRPADEALAKPVHAHRLDAPVGGLLVVAKTKAALRELTAAFEERRIKKRYRAVVIGRPPADEGSITDPVDEKEALTRYVCVNSTASADFGQLSVLDLSPETGRKHQLRIHTAQGLGTPILGDLRYGPDETLRTRGLFLFSYGLAFAHPVTGAPLELEVGLPEIFMNTVNMERKKAEAETLAAAQGATADDVEEPASDGG